MKETLFLLGTLVAGCGAGSAPELSNFQITTNPAIRGQQINGTVRVSDIDGLGGIQLHAELTGPAAASLDIPAQGVSDAITEGDLGLILLLSMDAPAGRYTAELIATDIEDLESDPVTTSFDVQ